MSLEIPCRSYHNCQDKLKQKEKKEKERKEEKDRRRMIAGHNSHWYNNDSHN